MNNTHEHKPQVTQGSGSAENTGESRDAQKNRSFDLDNQQKQDIANQINVDNNEMLIRKIWVPAVAAMTMPAALAMVCVIKIWTNLQMYGQD